MFDHFAFRIRLVESTRLGACSFVCRLHALNVFFVNGGVVDDWPRIVASDHALAHVLHAERCQPRLEYELSGKVLERRNVLANIVAVLVGFLAESNRTRKSNK